MAEPIGDLPLNHTYTPLAQSTTKETNKKIEEVLAEVPVLKEIIERLETKIAFLQNPETFDDDTLKNPTVFMHKVEGRKIAIVYLKTELHYLQKKVETVLLAQ